MESSTPTIRIALAGALACLIGIAPVAVRAQASGASGNTLAEPAPAAIRPLRAATPKPMPPASSPSPRLRPLDETGNSANVPGERQLERPIVAPQLNVPIGRTPPSPTLDESRGLATRRAATRDGIDDSAARCEARATPEERRQCRDGAGRGTPAPPIRR